MLKLTVCVGCGTSVSRNDRFCSTCGRETYAAASAPATTANLPTLPANVGAGADQVPLASFWQRWGAAFLDNILFWFTLAVGWLIWSWFTSPDGQSPGKKLVGLRVLDQSTGRVPTRGQVFARGLLKQGYEIFSLFLLYIPSLVAAYMFNQDPLRRAPWDRMMNTLVVYDPTGKVVAARAEAVVSA